MQQLKKTFFTRRITSTSLLWVRKITFRFSIFPWVKPIDNGHNWKHWHKTTRVDANVQSWRQSVIHFCLKNGQNTIPSTAMIKLLLLPTTAMMMMMMMMMMCPNVSFGIPHTLLPRGVVGAVAAPLLPKTVQPGIGPDHPRSNRPTGGRRPVLELDSFPPLLHSLLYLCLFQNVFVHILKYISFLQIMKCISTLSTSPFHSSLML